MYSAFVAIGNNNNLDQWTQPTMHSELIQKHMRGGITKWPRLERQQDGLWNHRKAWDEV